MRYDKTAMKRKRVDVKLMIVIILLVLFLLSVAAGSYFYLVRRASLPYNLTVPENGDLPPKAEAVEDDYVELSDVRMHYVRYGTGAQPVVLIHGNGGNADSLKTLAQYLAADYSVYCVDSRCQGKSSDPGVITYDLMAGDVYEFINAMLTVKPFVLGHSDGAIVALSLASLHPDSVGAVVSCGANSRPDKFKWYFTFAVKVNNLFHRDKLNDLMLELPDFTPDYLSRITAPTYYVAGEFDIMPLADTVYLHNYTASSRIAIIQGANHSNYISGNHGGRIYHLAHAFFSAQPQSVPRT